MMHIVVIWNFPRLAMVRRQEPRPIFKTHLFQLCHDDFRGRVSQLVASLADPQRGLGQMTARKCLWVSSAFIIQAHLCANSEFKMRQNRGCSWRNHRHSSGCCEPNSCRGCVRQVGLRCLQSHARVPLLNPIFEDLLIIP